jgi:hypothetical protein
VRDILMEVTITEEVQNKYTATTEEMSTILEDKINKFITVEVIQRDVNKKLLRSLKYTIIGDNYDLIMSVSPSFAPNKLENEYRECDLWYIIDLLRSQQN